MNHLQAFIPNYLPPSARECSSDQNQLLNAVSSTEKSDIEHVKSELYRERFNHYLDSRKIQTKQNLFKNKPSTVITLGEFTKDISHYFNLTRNMNKTIEILLREVSTMNKQHWNAHISKLDTDIKDLNNIFSKYIDEIVRNNIQYLVRKRQTKRNNIRKRKVESKLQKNLEIKRRTIKHQQIDSLLTENVKNISLNRHERETRQRAEIILMDVKSRKNEADSYILILESLQKLHRLRNRYGHSSIKADDESYREMDEIKKIWINALKNYDIEEKSLLNIVFDTNNFEEWCDTFFEQPLQGKLFTFLKKNKSLNRIISNRIAWDKCIVPNNNPIGMNLPFGWACPNSIPFIDKWKAYLRNT